MGNKLAILGGDFLLARASVALAQLRDPDVIAMLARVIEHLVTGEVMQMTASEDRRCSLEYYKRKTYYKTASLLANSSRAVAALGGLGEAASQNAYAYGKHVGLAFQFVDDHLDFTASSALLGKPAGNDLRQGIATAPVLFAAEEHKELLPLIRRKFAQPGDAERALELVGRSEGLERTQQLAEDHAAVAVEALKRLPLPEGEGVGSVVRTEAALAREALVEITRRVLERKR
jgi:geranyl diphosphate synthase